MTYYGLIEWDSGETPTIIKESTTEAVQREAAKRISAVGLEEAEGYPSVDEWNAEHPGQRRSGSKEI